MYVCPECGEIFEEPIRTDYDEPSEYWGSQVSEHWTLLTCPHCGCEDIEEARKCRACGEPTKNELICDDCMRDLQRRLETLQADFGVDHEQFEELIAGYFGW